MQATGASAVRRLLIVFGLLFAVGVVSAQTASDVPTASPLTVAFQAVLPYGLVTTAVHAPGNPAGMIPLDSGWGVGVDLEYAVVPAIRLFVDGNYATYRKQVGVAGQNSSGDWVFQMTNYSTNQLSFSQDAYFDMTATGFRAGLKAVLPLGSFQPWAGAGYGYYRWDASYDTSDGSSSWGSDSGYVWGLTYLAGIDWRLTSGGKNQLLLRLYADLAAPVAFPVINNLFSSGWTWDNSGGNNIMGAYRFGIAVGMPM